MIRIYSVPENTFEDDDGDDYSENEGKPFPGHRNYLNRI